MSGQPPIDSFNSADAANQLAILQTYLVSIYPLLYTAGIKPNPAKSYKHIIELYKQNNTAVMNKLAWVPGAFEFMDLTPDQMAQLVPQIRLYKQAYTDSGAPGKETEFVIPSKISTDTLLSDTTDQGLGIKNFQYRYVGSNPATVRNDIEAKLTLYFQNFSELLRIRHAPDNEKYSFLDLFSRANRQQQLTKSGATQPTTAPSSVTQASYKTTTNSRGETTLTPEAQEYQGIVGIFDNLPDRDQYVGPTEFEIKVVVGWAVPEGNTTLSYEQKEAIKSSSQSFFLTLIDHDFSFEQDGSFSVELNYRARLGAVLDSPQLDILRMDTEDAEYAEAQTWIDDAGFANVFEGSLGEIVNKVNTDIKRAKLSCEHEVAQQLQVKLDRLESNIRGGRYQKIANYLSREKLFYCEWVSSRVLNSWANTRLTYETDPLRTVPSFTTINPSLFQLTNDEVFNPYPTQPTQQEIDRTLEMLAGVEAVQDPDEEVQIVGGNLALTAAYNGIGKTAAYLYNLLPSNPIAEATTREKMWEQVVTEPRQTDIGASANDLSKNNQIIYFLFGDLLHYVIEEAKKPSPVGGDGVSQEELDKIKILISSCDLGIPGDPIYPITHIPISWEAFRNFWFKKVIRPRRDKYPLLQFIRDAIRDLIFGALNSVYYNNNTKRFTNTFKSAFISLPSKNDEDPIIAASREQQNGGLKIDLGEYTFRNPLTLMDHRAKAEDMYHYLCIFVEDGKKGQFSYQSMRDAGYKSRRAYNKEQLNIHHFGFGEDRGVLKSANFSKTDQPYLRESRYLERGGDPLIQLSNVYEASITLFGAPFFYPGQYIWINPYGLSKSRNSAYRLGSPDAGPTGVNGEGGSIANLMGLGGYHIIIDVEGIIEDGLYEVKINARFDNSGATLGDREGYGAKDVKRCDDRVDPIANP